MVRENRTWSRRRIAGELAKLGHRVDKNTVATVHAEGKLRSISR